MKTELHWITADWPGRLAIMPRPRGGDWLEDEVQAWRRAEVSGVVSLLVADEVADLGLAEESHLCRANGIHFTAFPIADRDVPTSREAFSAFIADIGMRLASGETIAVHCRQGIGRAATVAICALVAAEVEVETAVRHVSAARGCPVPETAEQREYIAAFAKSAFLR
ncbi:protein-tyrosine phosphatase family protein [Limnoglobus roseus]|uniref:Dual specificity protein phosphatase n=1 Tax=Limnoglobus roseus TaxID=2598579 RepID=A0A5C1AJK9_9BACT|nr:dual specificity protein phosphatase family protein [Limnoglobus roseus]QEL17088.1 dual specificity protein phosphatase [Limnoglobus roseus]